MPYYACCPDTLPTRLVPHAPIPVARLGASGHDERVLDPNFVLDEGARKRLITRFGAGVGAWCAALPQLVERCCLRWDLDLDRALSSNSSRVFIGRQHVNRGSGCGGSET